MALIKCLECSHEISDKAKSCPKCGYELNVPRKKSIRGCSSLIGYVLIGFLALAIIGMIFSDDNDATETKEIVTNSPFDASVIQIENYLKSTLRDPDSYEGIDWSEVQIVNLPQHKYVVRHKYRAKNGFGGYIIENQLFYLDSLGAIVNISNF